MIIQLSEFSIKLFFQHQLSTSSWSFVLTYLKFCLYFVQIWLFLTAEVSLVYSYLKKCLFLINKEAVNLIHIFSFFVGGSTAVALSSCSYTNLFIGSSRFFSMLFIAFGDRSLYPSKLIKNISSFYNNNLGHGDCRKTKVTIARVRMVTYIP